MLYGVRSTTVCDDVGAVDADSETDMMRCVYVRVN